MGGFRLNLKSQKKGPIVELDRKLWLTADRERAVEDGDPEAAFLLGNEGTEIPDAEAVRLGLKKAPKTADKQAAPAENKGVTVTRKG